MPEKETQNENSKLAAASTGNASNPSGPEEAPTGAGNQLLDPKAEQYLREAASIEDMPDDKDWQEADEILRKENKADTNKA